MKNAVKNAVKNEMKNDMKNEMKYAVEKNEKISSVLDLCIPF